MMSPVLLVMSFVLLMMSSVFMMMDVICITGDVISYDVIISFLTALHLSKDRLRNVFMNTSNLSDLCDYLSIPRDIKRDVVNATEYYHKSTQPRKVRKLISNLDWIGDTALADSVMDCAEPPAGMYIYYEYGDYCHS